MTISGRSTVGAVVFGLAMVMGSSALAQTQPGFGGAVAAPGTPPSAGPWLGVWKSSPEKTALANGRPAPAPNPNAASSIFRMVAVGNDAFVYTIETIPAGGGPSRANAACLGRFDGKDYLEIGNAGADTNRFRIVDPNTYEIIDMKGGKEGTKILVSISADGKTRTSRSTSKNAQGQETTTITVRERVE